MDPDNNDRLNNDDGRVLIMISRFSEPTGLGMRYNALVVLVSSLLVFWFWRPDACMLVR